MLPALKAVGINAGLNLVRGKPLLQNAPLAGITGGAFGGQDSLLGQTQFGKSIFGEPVGSTINAGAKVIPQNAAQFETMMNLPQSGKTVESFMGAAGTDGVYRHPEYFSNIFGTPVYTGNEGLLSQIGTGAGSIWDSAKANIPDYVTPKNLLGAANVLSNIQPRQQTQISPSPTGGVRQGGNIQSVNFGMAQPIPRRRGIM